MTSRSKKTDGVISPVEPQPYERPLKELEEYTSSSLCPDLGMVYWQEPPDLSIEDPAVRQLREIYEQQFIPSFLDKLGLYANFLISYFSKKEAHDMRVAAYYRQSTVEQTYSISSQQSIVIKQIESLGFKLVAEEQDICSGANLEIRSGLTQLIKMAAENKIDVVVIYDVSRLTRGGNSHFWSIQKQLWDYGVKIYCCKLSKFLSEQDSLHIAIEASQARDENIKRSRDTTRGMILSFTQKKSAPGGSVYGYDRAYINQAGSIYQIIRKLSDGQRLIMDPETKTVRTVHQKGEKIPKVRSDKVVLVPGDPEHVKIVREIFNQSAGGVADVDIVDALNQKRVPGPRGGEWNSSTVRHMLSNQTYIGDLVFNKKQESRYHTVGSKGPIENDEFSLGEKTIRRKPASEWIIIEAAHEPLIKRDIFEQVQERKSNRRESSMKTPRSINRKYLLTGILKCDRCGGSMQGHTKTSSKAKGYRKYPQYVCSTAKKYGNSACKHHSVKAEVIEQVAIERLRKIMCQKNSVKLFEQSLENYLRNQVTDDKSQKRKEYEKELKDIAKQKPTIFNQVTQGQHEFFADQIDAMMAREKWLKEQITVIDSSKSVGSGLSVKKVVAEYKKRIKQLEKADYDGIRDFLEVLNVCMTVTPSDDNKCKEVRLWFDPFVYGQPKRKIA